MRTTISAKVLAVLAVFALLASVSCGKAGNSAGSGDDETGTKVYIGKIKSGFMGVGGEHTGWMLLRGGKDPDLEADVSGVLARAKELDGKKVRAIGTIHEKPYVERGNVKILKIDSLQPVPE